MRLSGPTLVQRTFQQRAQYNNHARAQALHQSTSCVERRVRGRIAAMVCGSRMSKVRARQSKSHAKRCAPSSSNEVLRTPITTSSAWHQASARAPSRAWLAPGCPTPGPAAALLTRLRSPGGGRATRQVCQVSCVQRHASQHCSSHAATHTCVVRLRTHKVSKAVDAEDDLETLKGGHGCWRRTWTSRSSNMTFRDSGGG
jgi:hypothetical protein